SNEPKTTGGDSTIALQAIPGGAEADFEIGTRAYLKDRATVQIAVVDANKHPLAARISVTDANGKFFAPLRSAIYADDGFDRRERSFERHYFYAFADEKGGEENGVEIVVPEGEIKVEVSKGLEYQPVFRTISVRRGILNRIDIALNPLPPLSKKLWI